MNKLHDYLRDNDPDILVRLELEGGVTTWTGDRVASVEPLIAELQVAGTPLYLIEETCLQEMTKDLRPSRFGYVANVFSTEFEDTYYRFRETGVLTYEIINILETCQPVFEQFPLTEENEDNRLLYYAVTGSIRVYLDNQQ